MATDVKFGLVVGLGVVLAVAVTYYPKAGSRGGGGAAVPSLPAPAREATSPAKAGSAQNAPAYYGRSEVADAR